MSRVDFAQENPFKKKAGKGKSNEKEYFPLHFFQRIVLLSRIVFDPREILNWSKIVSNSGFTPFKRRFSK